MSRIRAEFEAFHEAEIGFEKAVGEFEKILDDLDGELRASLAEWSGEARDAYETAHANWARKAREIHAAIAELHKVTRGAHGNFRSAQTANLRMWQAI